MEELAGEAAGPGLLWSERCRRAAGSPSEQRWGVGAVCGSSEEAARGSRYSGQWTVGGGVCFADVEELGLIGVGGWIGC